MSAPFEPRQKTFTFDGMVARLRAQIAAFSDSRTGNNTVYSMEDAALGAFSVFFTQSPSFLSFQISMALAKGCSNAQTLFGMGDIPTDNHIRNLLDPVAPSTLFPVFRYLFNGLLDSGYLTPYRSYNNDLLVALDGTQTFSSKAICCPNCSVTNHSNGTTIYSHTALTPVIVASGNPHVISLEPEFITPQDGHEKQDCENAAAKRWLTQYGPAYQQHGFCLLGDDLYCKQPLCEAILAQQMNFILICKPDSHKTLYEWIEGLQAINEVTIKHHKGKTHYRDTYRFVNQVPLRDGEDALMVNWCELITTRVEDGNVMYHNAFATNHTITADNVLDIVRDGRARWKIENENNNTLKNHGYNLTHNFGHGKENLSSLMVTFNLLAFLFHTVLSFMDDKYRLIRRTLPTRKTFFDDIRALTRYFCFDSWDALLRFMMKGLDVEIADSG